MNTEPRVRSWVRLAVGILLAVISAVLLTLAFPPHGIWPLIWIGFVPMLVAQYRVMPRKLSSLASAIAVGGWLGGYLPGSDFRRQWPIHDLAPAPHRRHHPGR